MKIGDEVYVHGFIDEIRNDVIIIRNDGGYFGTVPSEVVEQEPTAEYSSDVISRQAAIDALYDKGLSMTAWGELLAMKWSDIQTCIELLPSAQPFTAEQIQTMQELEFAQVEKAYELGKADRPKGHWIETAQAYYEMINEKGGGVDENTPYFIDDIACSECLAKFSVIDNETERFDFCPNCGCAMKGGEEE